MLILRTLEQVYSVSPAHYMKLVEGGVEVVPRVRVVFCVSYEKWFGIDILPFSPTECISQVIAIALRR